MEVLFRVRVKLLVWFYKKDKIKRKMNPKETKQHNTLIDLGEKNEWDEITIPHK